METPRSVLNDQLQMVGLNPVVQQLLVAAVNWGSDREFVIELSIDLNDGLPEENDYYSKPIDPFYKIRLAIRKLGKSYYERVDFFNPEDVPVIRRYMKQNGMMERRIANYSAYTVEKICYFNKQIEEAENRFNQVRTMLSKEE